MDLCAINNHLTKDPQRRVRLSRWSDKILASISLLKFTNIGTWSRFIGARSHFDYYRCTDTVSVGRPGINLYSKCYWKLCLPCPNKQFLGCVVNSSHHLQADIKGTRKTIPNFSAWAIKKEKDFRHIALVRLIISNPAWFFLRPATAAAPALSLIPSGRPNRDSRCDKSVQVRIRSLWILHEIKSDSITKCDIYFGHTRTLSQSAGNSLHYHSSYESNAGEPAKWCSRLLSDGTVLEWGNTQKTLTLLLRTPDSRMLLGSRESGACAQIRSLFCAYLSRAVLWQLLVWPHSSQNSPSKLFVQTAGLCRVPRFGSGRALSRIKWNFLFFQWKSPCFSSPNCP